MTTHLVAEAIDSDPATYSSVMVGKLRQLGFEGKILTDDLAEMAGAALFPPEERIMHALTAGHNVALWCNNPQALLV